MPERDRPRRSQTQTERDLEGIAARRERDRRRDQVDELAEAADGVITQEMPRDEITKPTDVGDYVLERLTNDPAYRALWDRLDRFRADQRRSKRDTADKITDAMGKRPPNERLTKVETRVKVMWAIIAAVGTLAGGAAVTVAKGLYGRGETDGQHEIRLQQVERAVERLEHDIFDTRRRSGQPDYPALQPSKGTP